MRFVADPRNISTNLSTWAVSEAKTNCPKRIWTFLNRTLGTTRARSKSGTKDLRLVWCCFVHAKFLTYPKERLNGWQRYLFES